MWYIIAQTLQIVGTEVGLHYYRVCVVNF